MEQLFDYEDRLVRFAGEAVFFLETVSEGIVKRYYGDQLIRSSGSSALNYGEAQGTVTKKDFVFKMSLVVKELKESRSTLKILSYTNMGGKDKRLCLLEECEELIAIGSKMINNKRPPK